MAVIDKRNPKEGIFKIIRWVLCSICIVLCVVFGVLSCLKLSEKGDRLDALNTAYMKSNAATTQLRGILVMTPEQFDSVPYMAEKYGTYENYTANYSPDVDRTYVLKLIPGYQYNLRRLYNSSNLGTLISTVNFELVLDVSRDYNQKDIFRKYYQDTIIANLPEDMENRQLHVMFSKFDSRVLFDMWLAGFQSERILHEELPLLRQYDVAFLEDVGLLLLSYLGCVLFFTFMRPRGRFNCRLPKGERSSILGIPVYLSNILCYLTLGVWGVVLFFFERKSKYAKQGAVQAMLIGILLVIFYMVLTLVHTIFSFMFPLVENVTLLFKLAGVAMVAMFFALGLILSICGRVFTLPIVGDLANRSSNIDIIE